MRHVRTVNRWMLKGLEILLVVLILSMVLAGFGQVVMRKLFDKGFPAINTLLQLSVLWIAFLGATLATYRQKHIRIDILAQVLPPQANRWLLGVTNLVGIGLCLVLCKGGIDYFRELTEPEWSLTSNPIVNASFMVGFGLIALEFALSLLDVLFPEDTSPSPGGPDPEQDSGHRAESG